MYLTSSNIIDILREIATNSLVYPRDAPLEMNKLCCVGADSPCEITQLGGWTTHFLTHVDPPLHFVEHGLPLDGIPLERFISQALVIEVEGDVVLPEHIPADQDLGGKSLCSRPAR